MAILFRKLFTAFLIYLGLLLTLFLYQRDILYAPSGKVGLVPKGFQELYLKTDDGIKILSWYKKALKDQKTIIYFHGNGGNISGRSHKFVDFVKAGYGILAISYRGYPGSEGSPTQNGLVLDGKSAIDFLKKEQGLKENDIILYGESLGSGVSMQLAPSYKFYMIVLESPFSSVESVAKSQYWYAPVSILLKDKFDSLAKAQQVSSPVLIFHGVKDSVVDYGESQKLYQEIISFKKLVTDKEAGHVNFSSTFIFDELNIFINQLEKKK